MTSLDNLGSLYVSMKAFNKAALIYRKVVRIRSKTLGKKHPDYIRSLETLGTIYANMHENRKFEKIYKYIVNYQRTTLGEDHPTYLEGLRYTSNSLLCYEGV